MPVTPAIPAIGGEWAIPSLEGGAASGPGAPKGASFGQIMSNQVSSLAELQSDAAGASKDLALGNAEDPTSAVLAVERARLAMQLAVNVRQKLTDAVQTVMNTQV